VKLNHRESGCIKTNREKIQNTMKICSLQPYKSKKKPVGQTCLAFLQLYWHVFPTMISVYTRSKSVPSICARLFSIKTKRLNSSVIMLHVPPSIQQQMWKKQRELWLVKWCQCTCSSNLMCFANSLAGLHLLVNIFIPLSSHTIYLCQRALFASSKAALTCTITTLLHWRQE